MTGEAWGFQWAMHQVKIANLIECVRIVRNVNSQWRQAQFFPLSWVQGKECIFKCTGTYDAMSVFKLKRFALDRDF